MRTKERFMENWRFFEGDVETSRLPYPERIINSGRASCVERNYEMIDNSHYCIIYYDESNARTTRKSGTKIALDYAIKQGKQIIMTI